jgi:hypothetical protein
MKMRITDVQEYVKVEKNKIIFPEGYYADWGVDDNGFVHISFEGLDDEDSETFYQEIVSFRKTFSVSKGLYITSGLIEEEISYLFDDEITSFEDLLK